MYCEQTNKSEPIGQVALLSQCFLMLSAVNEVLAHVSVEVSLHTPKGVQFQVRMHI